MTDPEAAHPFNSSVKAAGFILGCPKWCAVSGKLEGLEPNRPRLDPIIDGWKSRSEANIGKLRRGSQQMAKQRGSGDWLVLEEKLERGDPSFVDDLRSFYDAEVLAGFAARWYADKRPASRRLLLDYLDRPLNAFRHEPLVKRLFKQAEAAGDDEVMARFMVLFDRSVRREERRRMHREWRTIKTQAEAQTAHRPVAQRRVSTA